MIIEREGKDRLICDGCHREFGKYGSEYHAYKDKANKGLASLKIDELILGKKDCEICGSEKSLDIHHVDGDWKNNNLENLQCLCRSCHMKIERSPTPEYRVRKLTPREVWRLMGFADEQIDKVRPIMSDAQMYKQAGNSIVVQVLEAIFTNLFLKDFDTNDYGRFEQLNQIKLF